MTNKRKDSYQEDDTSEELETERQSEDGEDQLEAELLEAEPELLGEERLTELLVESEDRYLRLLAEYNNYRNRTIKERDGIYPQAAAETVARFLPVLDNFERSLGYDCSSPEFADGIKMISQSFGEILTSLGVEEIGIIGEAFDPMLHNAILHTEDPELGENVISKVIQSGYRIGDRIIRHALVETAN